MAKCKMDFRAETSRKFNKVLQKIVTDSEKSQNSKIELKNYCIWQRRKRTRAQGHISK